jgi:hypothetical protein
VGLAALGTTLQDHVSMTADRANRVLSPQRL